MAIGFRKSLFGFNCDDVADYIRKSNKTFKETESALNEKIKLAEAEIEKSKQAYADLMAEKEKVSAELNEFNEKYNDIERLAEQIGKLYLVAQSNARAIMDNAEKYKEQSSNEVERNIETIEVSHKTLDELKSDVIKTSHTFIENVDNLLASLGETKDNLSKSISETSRLQEEFEAVYNSLENERV